MAFPDLISIADFGGDFSPFIDAVYQIYLDEVVNVGLMFEGKPVRFRFQPLSDGKGSGFWHAVSEGSPSGLEEDRTVDMRRCERISWVAHLIRNVRADGGGDVRWWKTKRRGATRVVIWMPAESFALVLEERNDFCLFVTCYCVRSHRAKTFDAEHADYWA